MIYVQVATTEIDITDAIKRVKSPGHGAVDVFIGTVRDSHNGRNVTGLTYDVHDVMAEKIFREICEESRGLWPDTRYALIHYKGALPVGGTSIVIAVAAPHRDESFEACRYVIESVKAQAPVWKQEHYTDGDSDWLPGHSLRHEADYTKTCCGKCCGGNHV